MLFKDRQDAGNQLLKALEEFKNKKNTLVLALPRGGVVVAKEISKGLHLPLDIIVPRKIGAPFNPELAIGSLIGDTVLLNRSLISSLDISKEHLKKTIDKEKQEAHRREILYRMSREPLKVKGKEIILVDDGIATGYTMMAAIDYLKNEKAKSIVVAIPVAAPSALERISSEAQKVVCLFSTENFYAIGSFYQEFDQVKDEEVISILKEYPSQ